MARKKEYLFSGTVTLRGVWFTVVAKSEAEAREKARNGEYEDYDSSVAEASDWEMNVRSMKVNE
jgi:hypothetical protein